MRPQVSFSIPAYSVDAHYALANVLDQRPPYELSRLSDTYVLPRPQSKTQDCCFLRTSFEDLMRSDAASKFANETRSCRTRSTTTRPCLLSINTPCDHISASGTSSTHASASPATTSGPEARGGAADGRGGGGGGGCWAETTPTAGAAAMATAVVAAAEAAAVAAAEAAAAAACYAW